MPSQFTSGFRKMLFVCTLLLSFLLHRQLVIAQCNGNISTYPYNEDFENNNGGWTTGGNNSDWAWGTPQKAIIKSAASGLKCWITGGLTAHAYNNNERSYLQSPCFDLTALHYPYIRFKLFCDTEQDWDGANLQYSPDNARTWIKIGYFGQPEDCFNSGWYNDKDVRFVSEQDGWSGANKNGGNWTVAQIKLPFTGGSNKTIMFRFYFGAGDKNKNYDGFGVDEFFMGEAPVAPVASFQYNCITNSAVTFTSNSSPCLTDLHWNFDDAGSGNLNDASGTSATHKFLSPGTYHVSLTASDNNSNNIIATNAINIITASVNVLEPVLCAGGTAKVQAKVKGSDIPYQYKWNTVPEITTADADLPKGSYTLEIKGENTCPAQVSLSVSEPLPLLTTMAVVQPDCNKDNGSIHVNASGGTPPYKFSWQPFVSDSVAADSLQKGIYNIIITDRNGCTATAKAELRPEELYLHLGNDTSICHGETITLYGGDFEHYLWDDFSFAPERTIREAGTYYLQVTNAAGCTASDTIKVTNDCGDIYFPSAFTPNGDLINDLFGPLGNISLLKNYSLHIYDRLGNIIFNSIAPQQKWNGFLENRLAFPGTYIYIATYEYNNIKKIKKGTILLLL